MAYAFVQQVETSTGAVFSTTLAAPSITPTGGNMLFLAATYGGANTTVSWGDAGKGNTFVEIGTGVFDAGSNQGTRFFYALNCIAGATTFTATFGASVDFRGVFVAEYSGIATSGAFLNGVVPAAQVNPGTGTDAVTTGVANATSQPAAVIGMTNDVIANSTPTAGTGYTSRTGIWNYGAATLGGRPEDKRVTVTGNVAATWTAVTGTDTFESGMGIFLEAGGAFLSRLPLLGAG